MADDWSAFPDAPDHDPWAEFPDDKAIKSKPIANPVPAPANAPSIRSAIPPLDLNGVAAVDGDTLRADDGRVRLWGVDAPELHQPGYDRQGQPVPIGQQSRDFLRSAISGGELSLGSVAGTSYGRTVAPVSVDGTDAGLNAVRSGNALAAPSYVRDDREYRFKLLEAERLARLNGLGPMNDTLAQNPADYRHAPGPVPARETVAQFWDTPTPWAGLRPEVEQRFRAMAYDPKVPLETVVAYARENGALVDQASLKASRDYYLKHGKAGGINYTPMPDVRQELGDGAAGAGVRGFGEGFVAGGLGELGAVADTVGGTDGRESVWNSDRRLADIWANNEFQNESILRGDSAAHPTASTVGEVGGAITSGFVIPYGAGARTAGELARVGAVYGGAEGFLGTDGGLPERLTGTVIGAPTGAILNAAGGKALQLAAPALSRGLEAVRARLPRKAGAAADVAGEAGIDYTDEAARNAVQSRASAADEWADFPDARVGNEGRRVAGVPLASERGPSSLSAVNNSNPGWEEFKREGNDRFLLYTGPDGKQANVHLTVGDDGMAEISVDPFSREPNRFGPGMVRQAARDLKSLYPEIRGFRGERESGANPGRVQSIGMDAEPAPSLSSAIRQRDYLDLSASGPRALLDPATDAERAAAVGRVQPRDVLPLASNTVDGVEEAAAADAGRFVQAVAPNERGELSRGTVRGWSGAEVPKVGPTDLVGWLRLRGGMQDQGGELSAMGLSNAPRRGLDHVGQEAKFGPLVNNDSGSSLDDAALSAWEAGYFPEMTERPTVGEFLDALRDTHEGGTGRRFLPEDLAQLERYDAAQADRYALEQQQHEAGGPVLADRSYPADEAPPFPPIEAYEEWPSDAIKRVGNVDVRKLDSPQDIARALKTSHDALGGFDAATRGRIAQAETERLASELGMTADDLLSRRKGQALNAEEALAARQILAKSGNELVNLARRIQRVEIPGDEDAAAFQRALMRHAAIQEQVSGATAEAGRALSQFRMMADSRTVPGEVLAGIRDAGGGQKRIKEAANLLLNAIEGPPGRFNTQVRKAASPRFSDKLAELYINGLLSGPTTHVVNAVSNTMTAISQIPENAVASAIGGARRIAARKEVDRVMGGELGARLFGLMQGTKEGASLFARALRTGETSDTFSKISGHDMRAISGVKGEVIRIPGRLLNSADEFFKGMNRRAEMNALAYRQAHREGLTGEALTARIADLSANPTEAIELHGLDFARYMTFQRPLDGLGQKASQISREYPLLRPIITFVRTPVNLLKFAAERSPAAPLLKEWRADFKAGGARRDLAMARAALGTGFATVFYQEALKGNVTGSAPTDSAKNRYMRADGWQPYSVRIGDQWVSYSRLDPFAVQLGVAADLALRSEGMTDRQLDNYAMLTVASIMRQMGDKTWLSGVTKFSQALQDPERYGSAYLRSLGGALAVPNVFAQTARAVDPVMRDRKTMADELQARIPGLSDGLFPKRDIWGRPITNEGGVGPDILNPFRQSTMQGDPVNAAMLAIGARSGPPSKQHTVAGKRVDWAPEEYDRLQEYAGRAAYSGMAELISDPAWPGMASEAKRKAADKVFKKAREDAKAHLTGGSDDKPDPSDPWSSFPDADGTNPPKPANDAWSTFPDAPSRDVMADLKSAIPGIRFTSGFRTPEYNAALRRRGYHPANNSEHLDGSALDMLPPPGKSLTWLRSAVAKYDPKARLLVHDGHLHAGFNGYYGAPPLGGMKSAIRGN